MASRLGGRRSLSGFTSLIPSGLSCGQPTRQLTQHSQAASGRSLEASTGAARRTSRRAPPGPQSLPRMRARSAIQRRCFAHARPLGGRRGRWPPVTRGGAAQGLGPHQAMRSAVQPSPSPKSRKVAPRRSATRVRCAGCSPVRCSCASLPALRMRPPRPPLSLPFPLGAQGAIRRRTQQDDGSKCRSLVRSQGFKRTARNLAVRWARSRNFT